MRFVRTAIHNLSPCISVMRPVAFAYSPRNAGLRDDIGALARIEVAIGVGYRQ